VYEGAVTRGRRKAWTRDAGDYSRTYIVAYPGSRDGGVHLSEERIVTPSCTNLEGQGP